MLSPRVPRFQQLQVYLDIIRTDKEKRRKFAAKAPCERLVILVAFLAEFHNDAQLEELVKQEDEAHALLKDTDMSLGSASGEA